MAQLHTQYFKGFYLCEHKSSKGRDPRNYFVYNYILTHLLANFRVLFLQPTNKKWTNHIRISKTINQ